jgi:hypothetical protein
MPLIVIHVTGKTGPFFAAERYFFERGNAFSEVLKLWESNSFIHISYIFLIERRVKFYRLQFPGRLLVKYPSPLLNFICIKFNFFSPLLKQEKAAAPKFANGGLDFAQDIDIQGMKLCISSL